MPTQNIPFWQKNSFELKAFEFPKSPIYLKQSLPKLFINPLQWSNSKLLSGRQKQSTITQILPQTIISPINSPAGLLPVFQKQSFNFSLSSFIPFSLSPINRYQHSNHLLTYSSLDTPKCEHMLMSFCFLLCTVCCQSDRQVPSHRTQECGRKKKSHTSTCVRESEFQKLHPIHFLFTVLCAIWFHPSFFPCINVMGWTMSHSLQIRVHVRIESYLEIRSLKRWLT